MDTNQWPQGIGLVKPIESPAQTVGLEKKPRPQKEQALNCPRCNSTNTKFCYYNNYSLSQPRYFCKTCRRYWTEGGTMRNVPVGGGSRKNKRSSISTTSSSSHPQAAAAAAVKKIPDLSHLSTSLGFSSQPTSQNPKIHEGQDLNLAYPPTANYASGNTSVSGLLHLPYASSNDDNKSLDDDPNPSNIMSSSALELLKSASTNGICPKGLSSLMSMPNISVSGTTFYSSVLPMQDFKPKLNFSLDGFDHGGFGSSLHGISNNGTARLFLPYEDLKPLSMNSTTEQYNQQQNRVPEGGESTGSYWNGMLGGGTW